MAKCIQFGKWYTPYKYILLIIFFLFLKDVSFGSHSVEYFDKLSLIQTGNLCSSYFIHQIFCYLFITIICFIRNRREIDSRHSSMDLEINDIKLDNQIEGNQTLNFELIHNENNNNKGYPNKYLLLIVFIWVVDEELLNYFNNIFIHLDFWMLELIIISIFMNKILSLKLYSHQKLIFATSIIPFILKIITIVFCFYDPLNLDFKGDIGYRYGNSADKLKVLYVSKERPYWLLPLGILIYVGLIIVKSYINTKIKWLIDYQYISPNKILAYNGFIGGILCLLISFIFTFISCGDWDKGDDKRYLNDYFCKVHYKNKKYLESFASYFSFSEENKYIYLEMLSLIIGVAAFVGYRINFMKIIEFLTPVHIIFATPIYYLFNKSYLCLFNFIYDGYAFRKDIYEKEIRISLDYASDVVSLLGFLIFLEIIELNFCGLDYNLKRKILDRGLIDVTKADFNKSYDTNSDSANSTTNKSFTSLNDSDM